jgi:hypothetical protein
MPKAVGIDLGTNIRDGSMIMPDAGNGERELDGALGAGSRERGGAASQGRGCSRMS